MPQKLEIQIVGDTRDLERALSRAGSKTESFGGSLGKMGKTAALAAGGAGIAGLTAALKIGFDEWSQGQQVAAQTEAVLKSTGGAAHVTAGQVSNLANAIMKKSGVDDEAIQSGENLLLTFTKIQNSAGKGNDIFNQATNIMTDMSVALGQDMKSSAIQLGKALNDPLQGITALQRVGVSFTAAQKDQIKALLDTGLTAEEVAKKQKQAAADVESAQAGVEAVNKRVASAQDAVAAASDRVHAAQERASDSQQHVKDALDKVKDATQGVKDAQEKLADAHRGEQEAADKVKDALQGVKDAQQGLADAQRAEKDATDKVTDATNNVREAKERLRDTQLAAKDAQVDLTQARKDAAQQLLDLRDAAEGAALGEEAAQLRLERAQERLNKVNSDASATELDRREALLNVKEAEAGLDEAHKRRQKSLDDLNDAEKKGVEGSDRVVAAKKKVRDADKGVEDASKGVRDAQKGVQKALEDVADAHRATEKAARGIIDAQKNVQKAEQGVTDAHREAAKASRDVVKAQEGVRDAQEGVVRAQRDAADASHGVDVAVRQQREAQANLAGALKDQQDVTGKLAKAQADMAAAQKLHAGAAADSSKLLQAQKIILQELQKEVGGSAEAAGKTLPGQLNILQQQLSNLAGEGVGKLIVQLQELKPTFDTFRAVIERLLPVLKPIAQLIFDLFISRMMALADLIRGDWRQAWIDFTRPVVDAWNAVKAILAGIQGAVGGYFAAAATWLVDKGKAIFDGLKTGLISTWDNAIAPYFIGIPTKLAGYFAAAATWLFEKGKAVLTGLLEGFRWYWENVISPYYINMPKRLGSYFTNAADWLFDEGKTILRGLFDGFKWYWENVISLWYIDLPVKLAGYFAKASTWLFDKGKEILQGMRDGANVIWTNMVTWFESLPGNIAEALTRGVRGAIDRIKGWWNDLFGWLPHWARKILGIASPSKIFEEIGEHIVSGLIKGIGNMAGALKDHVEKVVQRPIDWAKKAIGDVGGFIGDVFGGGDSGSNTARIQLYDLSKGFPWSPHDTLGLPGYPAVDVMAKGGTIALSPAAGTIDKESGRAFSASWSSGPGSAIGLSMYLMSEAGRYFMTHFDRLYAGVGATVGRGTPLGTVGPMDQYPGHVHAHIHEGFHANGVAPTDGGAPPTGSIQNVVKDYLDAHNWASYWNAVNNIFQRESGWDPDVINTNFAAGAIPPGAGGIAQANPYTKMEHRAWPHSGDPLRGLYQGMWGINYMFSKYGNPNEAWAFWQRHNAYAKGGIFTRPTLGLIGEAGPEAVVPLNRLGGLTVHVHVAGSVVSEQQLHDSIYRSLLRRSKSNAGNLGLA